MIMTGGKSNEKGDELKSRKITRAITKDAYDYVGSHIEGVIDPNIQ